MKRKRAQEQESEELEEFGELEVAEYIVFLLALDTYIRYVEEHHGVSAEDDLTRRGVQLVRMADRQHMDIIRAFLDGNLPSATHKRMLSRAFATLPTHDGLSKRTFKLRTLLSLGGTSTMRAVFKSNRALREIKDAMAAAAVEDADKALDLLEAIPIRNQRLRKWIDLAAETAGSGQAQNPVAAASSQISDDARQVYEATARQDGAEPASDESRVAVEIRKELLSAVQAKATETAQRAMKVSREPDDAPRKSEVIGIATAAVTAAMGDPNLGANVPPALKNLDPEQMLAATTDGRVLVAAGAGSGKTSTLCSRLAYLVQERKVNPSRIFCVSFNKKAAQEIRERVASKVGKDIQEQMSIGTMHSIFKSLVIQYGTAEEKAALTANMIGKKQSRPQQRGQAKRTLTTGVLNSQMAKMWRECFDKDPPRAPGNVIQGWIMNNVSPAQAKAQALDDNERDLAEWYAWTQGFKGINKSWEPPCAEIGTRAEKSWNGFLAEWRSGGIDRLGDFSDMIVMCRDLLKRNAVARTAVQGMFDHIAVDECQDLNEVQHEIIDMISEHIGDGSDGRSLWMVGDEVQCVHEDTPVSIGAGETRKAKDLRVGETVLAYRNGAIVPQTVRCVNPSGWTYGYRVMTLTGKSLTMSPNHRIWASLRTIEDAQRVVYLMHREGFGCRVGVANSGARLPSHLEHADAVWVLDVVDSDRAAQLLAQSYSLTYGIPTSEFNQEYREIYSRFGRNGLRLLEDKHLDPALPNWRAYAATREGAARPVVQMTAHDVDGTIVTLEWAGTELNDRVTRVASVGFANNNGRNSVRKCGGNYRAALKFAYALSAATGAEINRRMAVPDDEPYPLINASSLHRGMSVLVDDGCGSIMADVVTSVERVEGAFVDLDVDDASNFFGGGILSHNSINRFVGARPELFTQFHGKEGWKTRSIATNYRCLPEIVEFANKLMTNHPRNIAMDARPDPNKARGQASIVVQAPSTHAGGAISVIGGIKQDLDAGAAITDYAVLSRNRIELNDYETACIIEGIPYGRKAGTSFLKSPETIVVMSYVNLAVGQDFERMQRSLTEILDRPKRFFLAAGKPEQIVQEVVDKRARRLGITSNQVNPLELFDPQGISDFMDALDPYRKMPSWKEQATLEALRDLGNSLSGLRASVDAGVIIDRQGGERTYTTSDLFGDILSIRGVEKTADGSDATLRETLMPQGAQGDDDDDPDADNGEAPIGNVEFLYRIASPTPDSPDTDPSEPRKFKAKIDELEAKAKDLRVDLDAWAKTQSTLAPSERSAPPCVVLSTVHSVKGAQWNNVAVVMAKGVFPRDPKPKPNEELLSPEEQERLAEKRKADFLTERQLAYVAMTRAAKNLTVVGPLENAYGRDSGPSVFVHEAGLSVGQNVPGKNDPTPDAEDEVSPRTVLAYYSGRTSMEAQPDLDHYDWRLG